LDISFLINSLIFDNASDSDGFQYFSNFGYHLILGKTLLILIEFLKKFVFEGLDFTLFFL